MARRTTQTAHESGENARRLWLHIVETGARGVVLPPVQTRWVPPEWRKTA